MRVNFLGIPALKGLHILAQGTALGIRSGYNEAPLYT